MTDYFALLGEPRRPWLEAEPLKKKFLSIAAETHPDRSHGASPAEKQLAHTRYTELNAAYTALSNPRERLRHLITLENGSRPAEVQTIPDELMSFFLKITDLCRRADAFLMERNAITSPLLKAEVFERGQQWVDELTSLGRELSQWNEQLLSGLRALDAAWNEDSAAGEARAGIMRDLEQLYQMLSYCARWSSQVQDRIVQLSF